MQTRVRFPAGAISFIYFVILTSNNHFFPLFSTNICRFCYSLLSLLPNNDRPNIQQYQYVVVERELKKAETLQNSCCSSLCKLNPYTKTFLIIYDHRSNISFCYHLMLNRMMSHLFINTPITFTQSSKALKFGSQKGMLHIERVMYPYHCFTIAWLSFNTKQTISYAALANPTLRLPKSNTVWYAPRNKSPRTLHSDISVIHYRFIYIS